MACRSEVILVAIPLPAELVVGQAQQIDGQYRFLLEDRLDLGAVGVLAQQSEQFQQGEFRCLQMFALNDRRVRKVVALEEVEAERMADLHLLVAFHFFGENRFAQRSKIADQLL